MEFYHQKLGFPIIRENYCPERDDWKIDLKMRDCEFELFIMKDHSKRLSPEAYGLRHIAFRVENVDATVAELASKGIVCLWQWLTERQGMVFYTAKGLPFTYEIKGNEIFFSRKEKSVTRSTIHKAYQRMREETITDTKQLGVFGASYIYPLLKNLGLQKQTSEADQRGSRDDTHPLRG